MNLLRKYIRELLTEKDVLAIGMCFPFTIEKADVWWNDHYEPPADPENDYGIKHPDLNNMDKFKVVHGTVTDKWKKPPKPIVHAWVEMGDLVFDDQTKITKPNGVDKDFYYDMYQPEVVAEYTAEQALNKCAVSGYEGPWDEESLTSMRQRDAWLNDGLIREYTRLLSEKQVRDQKKKRVLYHIGPRPASPKPMSRPDEQGWRRWWLDQDVKSGVFFSPNPIDIASYHGVSGDVYAYKIPEWVIAKAGGIHRYDHGSEVLISAEIWKEAEDEIEFMGKSMAEKELWEKIESFGAEPLRRSSGSRPGWMNDEEWQRASRDKARESHLSGLRATKHPKNAIRMMKPDERAEALSAFETIDIPREKDREIIDLLKRYMNELVVRKYIRELISESYFPIYAQDKMRIHHSREGTRVDGEPQISGFSQEPGYKPEGLWYECQDASAETWETFCDWNLGGFNKKYDGSYNVVLKDDGYHILHITNESDFEKFQKMYSINHPADPDGTKGFDNVINWPKVAEHYAGIEICPYLTNKRNDDNSFWYYGWDVASGCIWDKSGIKELIKAGDCGEPTS